MRKPSDDLHALIQSLTKSEKRFFRSAARSGNENKIYLDLFDAIEKQTQYDESSIKKRFKNKKWVKRLNATKSYLYQNLITNLASYYRKHEPAFALAEIITHIRILQGKGFYEKAEKLIQKAKSIASNENDYVRLVELIRLEGFNHPGGINPNDTEILHEQLKEKLSCIENEADYSRLYKKSYAIIERTGHEGFDEQSVTAHHQLLKHKLLQHFEKAKTLESRRQFINMHYFHALEKKDHENMLYWIHKAKGLYQGDPATWSKSKAVNYASTLLNLNQSYRRVAKFNEALTTLEELKCFYPSTKRQSQERLSYLMEYAATHHQIETLLAIKAYKKASDSIPTINTLFEKHRLEISKPVQLRHFWLIARLYFYQKEWKLSLKMTEKILQEKDKQLRSDIQRKAYILKLILLFEEEKYDLLEYQMRSISRLIQRYYPNAHYEKKLVKIIARSLNHSKDDQQAIQLLREIKAIGQLKNLEHEDAVEWLERRLH